METTVKLQDMYSYPLLPVYVISVIALAFLFAMLLTLAFKKKQVYEKKIIVKENPAPAPVTDIKSAKEACLMRIEKLERDRKAGLVNERTCYQKLSMYVREFVKAYTGTDTVFCTYDEIKTLDIPELIKLIDEYYEPEFSPDYEGRHPEGFVRDLDLTITKTKEAIREWK